MALVIANQKRIVSFKRGDKTITLPEMPDFTLEQMRKFYAGLYPELTTAILDGPKMTQNGAEYTFKIKLGEKG